MNKEQISRINELYHKAKSEGLTEEEKKEQAALRTAYIAAIRADMESSLDNVDIVNPDGSIEKLKRKE